MTEDVGVVNWESAVVFVTGGTGSFGQKFVEIVPAMTFAATANLVVVQGGTPILADVEPDTLLLDPAAVEAKLTPHTKAIVAVDYAGQPCEYDVLRAIADRSHLRWTVDTPEDLQFVRRIFACFGHDRFGWQEVLPVLEAHPQRLEINRHVRQKQVV